jgi:hypothetical protein
MKASLLKLYPAFIFYKHSRCANISSGATQWVELIKYLVILYYRRIWYNKQGPGAFIFLADRWYGIRIRLFFSWTTDTGSGSVYFFREPLIRDQDPFIFSRITDTGSGSFYFFADHWYGIMIRLFFCGSAIPDPGSFIFFKLTMIQTGSAPDPW